MVRVLHVLKGKLKHVDMRPYVTCMKATSLDSRWNDFRILVLLTVGTYTIVICSRFWYDVSR